MTHDWLSTFVSLGACIETLGVRHASCAGEWIVTMKAMVLRAAAGVAFALAASLPADAQFAYPTIIVPPPPAQNLVMPRPAPKPAAPGKPTEPAPAPTDQRHCYQGQTNICR
jgi:hypothetical protein